MRKNGYTVTAADFNGSTFDGNPLVPSNHESSLRLGALITSDQIVIQQTNGTDYATWKVATKDGEVIASPGDFIEILTDGTLRVDVTPENEKEEAYRQSILDRQAQAVKEEDTP